MKKDEIPLIIPNFNQMVYTINLVNWWNYYTNNAPVFIVDNKSTYKPLLIFYKNVKNIWSNVEVIRYRVNNCGKNLTNLIRNKINPHYKYYCISNPDIMPHPTTPENFLDIFKHCIEKYEYHRVGFALRINDLPDYITNTQLILKRQSDFYDKRKRVYVEYGDKNYKGHKAPIDLTFAMYSSENGGWIFPYNSRTKWNNALRLFTAYHLEWYIDPNTRSEETDYYYKTATQREEKYITGIKVKGVNSYRPNKKYEKYVKQNETFHRAK